MLDVFEINPRRLAGPAVIALLAALALPAPTQAGSYLVAQCAPGLFPDGPEASFGATSKHFTASRDCGQNAPGFQLAYSLNDGDTGTEQGNFGTWTWQAPAGAFITGGSAYSRLANDSGISGSLAVADDNLVGITTQDQNDDQFHLSGVPPGRWRYFVARLACTLPNSGNRCVGAAAAHAYVRELRLRLVDLAPPTLSLAGSMLDGGLRRGPQEVAVSAADQGAGLQAVQIEVNGTPAGGDQLAGDCNPLPEGLTSRLSPCPHSLAKTYVLDTASPPFRDGDNTVEVCALDYAQSEGSNADCESRAVEVDSTCPESPLGGGVEVSAAFAGNGKQRRTLPYGRRALIRGRIRDRAGNPVPGARVCIEGRMAVASGGFQLLGTAVTNQDGDWAYKLRHGASRQLRVAYRDGSRQISTDLELDVRAASTLRISRRRTGPHQKVYFSGRIPGPRAAKRVVFVRGTIPGARRRFLIRHALTDAFGRFRVGYAFAPVPTVTRFVFWVVVPKQNGYPYLLGHSVARYLRVRP